MKKFKACNNCDNGIIHKPLKNGYEAETISFLCDCKLRYKIQQYFKLELDKSNIPKEHRKHDLSSYKGEKSRDTIKKIKVYIDDFREYHKHTHLYFWSKINSTQKTTVASCIGKALIKQKFIVRFVFMEELLKLLQNIDFSMKEENYYEMKEKIKEYYEADFLIIDDCFDTTKVTLYKSKYQLPFLDSFLRKRLEQYTRATCFTSNIPINEIGMNFGISIEKLIQRNIIIPMQFKDYAHFRSEEEIRNFLKRRE